MVALAKSGLSFTETIEFPALNEAGKDVAYFTVPAAFDPQKPFFLVIFFHGFDEPFAEQIERLALASQVASSGANCILVCPRTAIDRATETNPGKLGDEDYFEKFLGALPPHVEKRLAGQGVDTTGFLERAAAAPLVVATFSAGHRLASCNAVVSTRAPIAAIRPVSSAHRMNAPGSTRPRSGCCQRSSASKPRTRPSAMFT